MEGKIGVVASRVERVGKGGRHRLAKRRYVATFGSADALGRLTYAAACELQATEARQPVVLGDGADWIKVQANERFPQARKILDWPHICGAKCVTLCALCSPVNAPAAVPGANSSTRRCYPCSVAHLQRLRPASGEVPVALEEVLRSLDTQAAWIGNSQAWQERGLVERAVAVVINARMKKRGMRWKRANAHAVVALRVHYLNVQWEAVA